ncbi:MAG: hypothetical protein KDC99_17210 [Cyclobacteriaceae bacterium]|nr:hypothetical protein [Cyclobacteriaceae bacterium]
MRVLLFIFAVGFLALAITPCSGEHVTEAIECESSCDTGCEGEETCTPFCTSACCTTHFVTAPLADTYQQADPLTVAQSPYQAGLPSQFISRFWQPPKKG